MPLTPDQALKHVQDLYQALTDRRHEIETLDSYYEGKQGLRFASPEWQEFHRNRYQGFSDNWCGVVANSPAERLRVDGVRIGERGSQPSDDEKRLWDVWLRNDMEAQSSQGFLESIVARRSFALVWGDADDQPVVTWEHPSQVIVGYDPERPTLRRMALKAWLDGDREFATLYTADEIWKFERKASKVQVRGGYTDTGLVVVGSSRMLNESGGKWDPRTVNDEQWPLTNPLGEVPIVEFANRPMLGRQPISDISGTKAMQDAINLLWAYLFTASDHASFPARVVLGQEPPKVPIIDSQGQKVGEKQVDIKELQHGRFLWLTGEQTKVEQWDAAKLDVFTAVIEVAIGHIAAQTRTPPHYLVTNKGLSNLSGDALVAAETGLVKKVQEQQLFFGPSVRDVFRLMALVEGKSGLAESVRLAEVIWKDAQYRSDSQMADANLKRKQYGYPLEYLLELDGLPPQEIERVMAMVEKERRDPQLDDIAQLNPTDDFAKRVTAAGTLIRSGFDPEASAVESGLPKIKHTGLLPVTIQTEEKANATPQASPQDDPPGSK